MSSTEQKENEIKRDWTLAELKKDNCKSLWKNVQKNGYMIGHCVPPSIVTDCTTTRSLWILSKVPRKVLGKNDSWSDRQIEKSKSDQDKLENMSIECLTKRIASYSYFGLSKTKFAPQGILLKNGDFYVHYGPVSVYQQNYGAHSHDKEICLNSVHVPPNEYVRLPQGVKIFYAKNDQEAPFECVMKDDMIYIIHDKTGGSGRTGNKKSVS